MLVIKKYIGFVFATLVACSSNKSNQELIIGTWTTSRLTTESDLAKASIYTYNKDSSYNTFFGDYASNGLYYITENQLCIIYPTGDTSCASILELNDSILILKYEISNFESTSYRFGF